MKAKLVEKIPAERCAVEIESETEEEEGVLLNIWNTHGRVAALTRKADGHIFLVVAPTVEGNHD